MNVVSKLIKGEIMLEQKKDTVTINPDNNDSIQFVECIVCKTMVPAYKYCGNCGLPTGKSVKYRN